MGTHAEIADLEERLRQAELGPDAAFYEEYLADDAVLVTEDGSPARPKKRVVEAHRPGAGPKFTRVEMSDLTIIDHGAAAVVTCTGTFEGPQGTVTLRFMRVWQKRDGRWRIIAGSVSR